MILQPRWYQGEAVGAIYDFFDRAPAGERRNPIVAMPTGTGKAFVQALFIESVLKTWPWQRMLNITHSQELVLQNYKELMALWPQAPAGIYSAGLGRREVMPITFCGIMSMVGRAALFGHIDLVFIDECHMVGTRDEATYNNFLEELWKINPKMKVIGLSATPFRMGQGLLTDPVIINGKVKKPLFTDICYDITGVEAFNRLIAEGFICPLFPKETAGVRLDVSNVKVGGEDFNQRQLEEAVKGQDELTWTCIQDMVAKAAGRKHWLVFGTGIQHCERINEMLNHLGVSSLVLHSKTKDRDKTVEQFTQGEVTALVNNAMLTTGFNYKPIDLIGDVQPTASVNRHVQKYGRGTRPAPEAGKINCIVYDYAGNTRRNGPINAPKIPKRKGFSSRMGAAREVPMKSCEHCLTLNSVSARNCGCCGELFPTNGIALSDTSDTLEIIKGGTEHIVEVFKVDRVDIQKFIPNRHSSKPPSILVTYFVGMRSYREFVALEHIGYGSKRARDWWREAANDWETEPPATVDDALTKLNGIRRPTHLKIWVNCPDPQILARDYSGTAFGAVVPSF